jgi:hypothetical protein
VRRAAFASAWAGVVKIPLNRIMVGEYGQANPPAGMDVLTLMSLVAYFRKTGGPCDPPIKVTIEGDYWRVDDGRHRYFAAVIAGRQDIEAEVV